MRRTVVVAVVVGVVGVVVVAAGTSAVAARANTPLRETNWVLTDRVSIGTPLAGVPVNAIFDGTHVTGTSGCNGYSRSYTTDGARMNIINDGVSTLIACPGATGKVEPAYLARLDRVGRYRVSGTTLTLSTRGGRRLLVFRASVGSRALSGGWNATGIYTGDAISSAVPGSALTLEFADDRASGNSGCNTFNGPVKLSGVDRIALGPFTSTLRACADPAVATQEQQYLEALALAKTYQVTGDRLTLFHDGGTIAATFEPRAGSPAGADAGSVTVVRRDRALLRRHGQEDPRIAAQIQEALGAEGSVLNVGAGTGNYEPVDGTVVALDASLRMLAQRTQRSPLVVHGVAERLPFPDRAFRAALAVFTMQHWTDRRAGLRELRRVSHRQVIVFHQLSETSRLWMVDYFDEVSPHPTHHHEPDGDVVRACLQVREVQPVLVPHDCVDGFGAAFWARPEAYLDPAVQAGISELASLPDQARARWTARLAADLESGEWDRRHGDLRTMTAYDAGYRLAIAET